MDRHIVQPGQIPVALDLLDTNRNAMVALAKLSEVLLGSALNVFSGFACTPTSPASMQVSVAAGQLYSSQVIDATSFGSMAADTTHTIVKQGINLDAVLRSCPAPLTVGYSQNFLIELGFAETDTDSTLRTYYNASSPATPWMGPANDGIPDYTRRRDQVTVQAKAGTAATTGTQTTPAPDSGFVGAFVVTVAYGQTTITSGNIAAYTSALQLPAAGVVPGIQAGSFITAPDIGAANAYAANYQPAVTALIDGMVLEFQAAHANTTASTFSPNGLTPVQILGTAHAALVGGEIANAGKVALQYHAGLTAWILIGSSNGAMQAPTAPQFDNTTKIANTAFVQRALGNYRDAGGTAVGITLTAAQAGLLLISSSGSPMTHILPAEASVPNGALYGFLNDGSSTVTVQRAGSDTIYLNGNPVTSVTLQPGDTLRLVCSLGSGAWFSDGGAASLASAGVFGHSLGSLGYQKLPGGLIVQWGSTSNITNGDHGATNFPIAFPNNCYSVVASYATGASSAVGGSPFALRNFTLTNFDIWNGGNAPSPYYYIAIGN